MVEQNEESSWLSRGVSTGKDLVALLRDSGLLLSAILLIGWPETFNNILVEAGFEEGSFAGLKWRAKLTESDDALLRAQATIADLRTQNQDFSGALTNVKSEIKSVDAKENIARLQKLNLALVDSAAMVQAAVQSTTSSNARFVEKIQASLGEVVTWGVVYGGDSSLESARHEVDTVASRLGLTNAAIYYRQGSYRSVASTTNRLAADQLLRKAMERRKDAYIVNMATWCPQSVEKQGYFECLR